MLLHMRRVRLALCALVAFFILHRLRRRRHASTLCGTGACVVVTGASRGIGASIARRLAGLGFRVYAGVRSQEDGQALQSSAGSDVSSHIVPVLLDVTHEDQIRAVALRVAAECARDHLRLAAIVNNAGVNYNQAVEATPIAEFRRVLEVNAVSVVSVTQRFLPLLRANSGRVVILGSLAGHVSRPLNGAFSASKACLEAIADSLRTECRAAALSGAAMVHVSLVEPGRVPTPGLAQSSSDADSVAAEMGPDLASGAYRLLVVGRHLQQSRSSVAVADSAQREAGCNDVVEAVLAAMSDAHPRARYYVGSFGGVPARVIVWLKAVMPERALDAVVLRAVLSE